MSDNKRPDALIEWYEEEARAMESACDSWADTRFVRDGQWYFFDTTGTNVGPYSTEAECLEATTEYGCMLERMFDDEGPM
jgi:hypothetical protein